ncbi:MAG: hypothetical protein HY514_03700 [Candidatus Aenigmarchaeota archaeon]|nr:hypothetical protein [Candidatus Aenigmarchaeota archaeon]
MVTEKYWQRAVHEECYRREFVGQIDLEDSHKYVNTVRYSHKRIMHPQGGFAATRLRIPFLARLHFKGIRSDIEVYSKAFSAPTLQDFLGLLIDHEGYHAKEIYENPEVILPSIVKYLQNQLSVYQSIANPGPQQCSS